MCKSRFSEGQIIGVLRVHSGRAAGTGATSARSAAQGTAVRKSHWRESAGKVLEND